MTQKLIALVSFDARSSNVGCTWSIQNYCIAQKYDRENFDEWGMLKSLTSKTLTNLVQSPKHKMMPKAVENVGLWAAAPPDFMGAP